MSTARQIKALIKPLLVRNPDLVMTSPLVLTLSPVRNVARHIYINRRRSASYFGLEWRLSELFLPEPIEHRAWDGLGWCGDLLGRSERYWVGQYDRGGNWEWADPTMAGDFIDRIEDAALPAMRTLDTAEACIAYASGHSWITRAGPYWWLMTEIALGDVEAAQRRWRDIGRPFRKTRVFEPNLTMFGEVAFYRLCELGEPLMAGDRAALVALLRRWEAENAASAGLAAIWEPTPLPIERG